jgi:hypothetical protein
MKTKTTFIMSLAAILTLAAGSAFGKYSGGTGESNDPYQIASAADLLVLSADANDYGLSFILTADINMEGQVFTTAIIAADTNSDSGFQGTAFTGTFDGKGYKIVYFTINDGNNPFLGLFGFLSTGGSVTNLGTENVDVNGYYSVGGLVGCNAGGSISDCYSMGTVNGIGSIGGLVGWSDGNITGCYSTGSVSSKSGYAGGLLGDNSGNIGNCYSTVAVSCGSDAGGMGGLVGLNTGSAIQCYSTGSVSGGGGLGGLVGGNTGSIIQCYSTGSVSGSSSLGGLAGGNSGNINNCYSTGAVSGPSVYGLFYWYIGGLVGDNDDNISDCYSTGAVSGGSKYVGGFVGGGDGNTISSFWDTETSGWATSAGGEGKTTAEMKTLSTFILAEWDFVEAWGIGNGQTYPYLKPFNGTNPADLNYSGTVDFADFAILAANWLSGE